MKRTPSAPRRATSGVGQEAGDAVSRFASPPSAGDIDLELPGLVVVGEEREPPAIGRPGDRVFGVAGLAVARRDPSRRSSALRQVGDEDPRMPRRWSAALSNSSTQATRCRRERWPSRGSCGRRRLFCPGAEPRSGEDVRPQRAGR